MRVAPLNNDNAWADHPDTHLFSQGPFEFAFDSANGILYSASNNAGLWALKVSSP